MKKILSILLVGMLSLGMVACGDSKDTAKKDDTSKPAPAETKKEEPKKEEPKTYSVGDTVYVKDDAGKQVYSLTINSVKNASDFEYKEDFEQGNQIIEVSYTYANIDRDTDIYIHSEDLTVSDEKGSIAKASSMFPKGAPADAPKGTNNTVEAYYGLRNKSNKVKINFKSAGYPKNNFTFETEIAQ